MLSGVRIERLKDEKIALLEAELMQMKIQARKDKYKMKKQQVESELNMGPQSDVSMQGTSYQDDNSATPEKNMGFTPPATQSTTYSTKTIEPKSKKKIEPKLLGPNQPIPPSLADADKEQHKNK